MIDTSSTGTLDETTLQYTGVTDVVVWQGPAQFSTAQADRTSNESGGDHQLDEVTLRVPVEAPLMEPGAEVMCMAAEDQELVGVRFEVLRSNARTANIVRRYTLRRRVAHL